MRTFVKLASSSVINFRFRYKRLDSVSQMANSHKFPYLGFIIFKRIMVTDYLAIKRQGKKNFNKMFLKSLPQNQNNHRLHSETDLGLPQHPR